MKPFNSNAFFSDAFFADTATIAGVEYPVVFDRDQSQDADGKLRPAAGMGELLIQVSEMPTRPAAYSEIIIGTETWAVQQVAQDGDCWRCAVKFVRRAAA